MWEAARRSPGNGCWNSIAEAAGKENARNANVPSGLSRPQRIPPARQERRPPARSPQHDGLWWPLSRPRQQSLFRLRNTGGLSLERFERQTFASKPPESRRSSLTSLAGFHYHCFPTGGGVMSRFLTSAIATAVLVNVCGCATESSRSVEVAKVQSAAAPFRGTRVPVSVGKFDAARRFGGAAANVHEDRSCNC